MSDDPPKPIQPVSFLELYAADEPDDAEVERLKAYLCDDPKRGKFDWINALGEYCLPASVKSVGLWLAQPARMDGTRAYPGHDRLARQSGLDPKTVNRGLAYLRLARLTVRVTKGNRRLGRSDEYWLIHPPDVVHRVELLPRSIDADRP